MVMVFCSDGKIHIYSATKNYKKTTTNHHKPPRSTTTHYEAPPPTTKHHHPLRSTTTHHNGSLGDRVVKQLGEKGVDIDQVGTVICVLKETAKWQLIICLVNEEWIYK